MNTPHKHAALIKAWADGAPIQLRANDGCNWVDIQEPMWNKKCEYRIKPKEPFVILKRVEVSSGDVHWNDILKWPNVSFSFDPDTGTLLSVEKI